MGFCSDMLGGERVAVVGDFNGYIGFNDKAIERIHCGYGTGTVINEG